MSEHFGGSPPSVSSVRSAGLGVKLSAGFALLMFLSGGVSVLAIDRMSAMDDAAAAMRDNYLPSTLWAGKLAVAVANVRRSQARFLLSNAADPASNQVIIEKMRIAVAAVDEARRMCDPTIDVGEERNRYNAIFDPTWADFRARALKMVEQTSPSKKATLMASYSTDKAFDDFESLSKFVAWDMNYNQTAGKAAGATSRQVYHSTKLMIIAAVIASFVLSLLTAFGLIRHIARPIAIMTAAMRRLAGRDMAVGIPCVGRGDEIGRMAGAVQVFRDSMVEGDRLAAMQAAEQQARQHRATRLEALVSGFERQIGSTVSMLASASTEMEATARSMTGSAAQTDQQATEVARAAEDSSMGVQTVAAASEQLASSIAEINRQVSASATLTERVVSSVRQSDDTVRALDESAGRIGQVAELINNIASQTNLLALNATIEAARAGDAGKGFAVVASEVKSLAQQTARATSEIGGQIAQVQQATGSAVKAMREIAALIEEVNAITGSIAAAVEQQGAATAEIARNVQNTAVSTRTVTSSIAGVSRAANDTGAAATQVLGAAGDLSRQAESLSTEVGSFVTSVRSV